MPFSFEVRSDLAGRCALRDVEDHECLGAFQTEHILAHLNDADRQRNGDHEDQHQHDDNAEDPRCLRLRRFAPCFRRSSFCSEPVCGIRCGHCGLVLRLRLPPLPAARGSRPPRNPLLSVIHLLLISHDFLHISNLLRMTTSTDVMCLAGNPLLQQTAIGQPHRPQPRMCC